MPRHTFHSEPVKLFLDLGEDFEDLRDHEGVDPALDEDNAAKVVRSGFADLEQVQ